MGERKNLWRGRGGRVIHRASCRYNMPRHRPTPWLWADDVSWLGVRAAADALGLKPCGACRPFRVTALTAPKDSEAGDG
jgi:hypothetical protein